MGYGVKNQVAALLKGGLSHKRIVMVSTMGTTKPNMRFGPGPDNHLVFWKLNAEAFLASSGVPFAIIKPCGLGEGAGGKHELLVGHDDSLFTSGRFMISRADVATLAAASLTDPPADSLRFDVCAKWLPGKPKPPKEVLQAALQPWQREASTA